MGGVSVWRCMGMVVCLALLSTTTPQLVFAVDFPSTTDLPSTAQPSSSPTGSVPCGVVPIYTTITNSQAIGNCTSALDGETCDFVCDEGYISSAVLSYVCAEGVWEQVDGGSVTEGACIDYDGCSDSPCDETSSVCVDDAPPSVGYSCECKPHHVGEPGLDGTGCSRVTITTVDGNIELKTGEGHDIGFGIGSTRFTVSELSTQVEEEITRASESEDFLSSAIETNVGSLEARLSVSIDDVEVAIDDASASLEGVIDGASTSLETRVANGLSDLSDDVDGAVVSLETRIASQGSAASSSLMSVAASLATALSTSEDAMQSMLAAAISTERVFVTDNYLTTTAASSSFYTKSYIDSTYYTRSVSDGRYYTKSYINNNFYTSDEADAAFQTQSETDARYYTKSYITSNYYTQTQSNNRYYTQSQSNGRYYTKSQADAAFMTQSETDARYYTKGTSDSRFMTQSETDNLYYRKTYITSNFYTQSYLNSRMAFPVNGGATRRRPLLPTNWMGDNDGGSYYQVYVDDSDGDRGVYNSHSSMEWFQYVWIPEGWRTYQLAVYGNNSNPNMYLYRRGYNSGGVSTLCSYSRINRVIGCNSSRYYSPNYQFISYLSGLGYYRIHGGYVTIQKT